MQGRHGSGLQEAWPDKQRVAVLFSKHVGGGRTGALGAAYHSSFNTGMGNLQSWANKK